MHPGQVLQCKHWELEPVPEKAKGTLLSWMGSQKAISSQQRHKAAAWLNTLGALRILLGSTPQRRDTPSPYAVQPPRTGLEQPDSQLRGKLLNQLPEGNKAPFLTGAKGQLPGTEEREDGLVVRE